MKILDLTAGNRAVWFDRNNPLATYVDVRGETEPDFIADARALPPGIGTGFGLVVFDPPHKNNGSTGSMVRNYGHFTHEQIISLIRDGAAEAWRVSMPDALMAFKWNDHGRTLAGVLELMDPYWLPLVGHGVSHQQRSSQTCWVLLARRAGPKEPRDFTKLKQLSKPAKKRSGKR